VTVDPGDEVEPPGVDGVVGDDVPGRGVGGGAMSEGQSSVAPASRMGIGNDPSIPVGIGAYVDVPNPGAIAGDPAERLQSKPAGLTNNGSASMLPAPFGYPQRIRLLSTWVEAE